MGFFLSQSCNLFRDPITEIVLSNKENYFTAHFDVGGLYSMHSNLEDLFYSIIIDLSMLIADLTSHKFPRLAFDSDLNHSDKTRFIF